MKERIVFLLLIVSSLLSTTVLVSQTTPPDFMLFQNVPDPFDSNGTQIRFDLNSNCHAHLFVEDTLRSLIRTLVDEQRQSGSHLVNWNARDNNGELIGLGAYVCKLIATLDSDTLFSDSIEMQFESMVTDIRQDIAMQPLRFSMQQNYPNPFNPSTVLSYTIPIPGVVSLTVYDIVGRKIETLVNEYQEADFYSVTFTARDLASGIYFYQLQVGNNFLSSKKMILLH